MDRAGGPFYDMLRQGIDPEEELAAVHRQLPRWRDTRTEPEGHHYRWPHDGFNRNLVAWMETRKVALHLARGDTLAPQRPIRRTHRTHRTHEVSGARTG